MNMVSDSLPLSERPEWDLTLCRSVENVLAKSHAVLSNAHLMGAFTDDASKNVLSATAVPRADAAFAHFSGVKSNINLSTSDASVPVMNALRNQLEECRDLLRQVDSERRFFRNRALTLQESLDRYSREREHQIRLTARTESQLRRVQRIAMDAKEKFRETEAELMTTTEKNMRLQRFVRSVPISHEAARALVPDRRFQEAFHDKMTAIKYRRRYARARTLFERRAEDAESQRMGAEDAYEAARCAGPAAPSPEDSAAPFSDNSLSASATWPFFGSSVARRRRPPASACAALPAVRGASASAASLPPPPAPAPAPEAKAKAKAKAKGTETEAKAKGTETEAKAEAEAGDFFATGVELRGSPSERSADAARCATARNRTRRTLQGLLALHRAYTEAMRALREAGGFMATMEKPRDVFAELKIEASDAVIDEARYEVRIAQAVEAAVTHAEAVSAIAQSAAETAEAMAIESIATESIAAESIATDSVLTESITERKQRRRIKGKGVRRVIPISVTTAP